MTEKVTIGFLLNDEYRVAGVYTYPHRSEWMREVGEYEISVFQDMEDDSYIDPESISDELKEECLYKADQIAIGAWLERD